MDLLIGNSDVNKTLGRVASLDKLNIEQMKFSLAAVGIAPVGIGPAGRPLYHGSIITGKKDEINDYINRQRKPEKKEQVVDEQLTLSIDQADLERAVTAAMREGIKSLQRYIDTSLAQFDEKLDKILACAQQSVRVSGEVINGQKGTFDAVNRMASSVSESLKRGEDQRTSARSDALSLIDRSMDGVNDELGILRVMLNELVRKAR